MTEYQPLKEASLQSDFLDFLNKAKESILSLDVDFRINYFNKSSEDLLKKYFPNGIKKGQNIIDTLNKENSSLADFWAKNLNLVAQKKETHYFEVNNTSDEGFRHFKVQIHPVIRDEVLHGFICRVENDSEFYLKLRLEKLLNDFKSKLFTTTSEDQLLWSICEDILSNLYLEDAIIFMKSGNLLVSKSVFGSKLKGHRTIDSELSLEIGKGIVGSVAISKEPELINDTSIDSRYFKDHFEAGSEIALPIVSLENELIGVINCESSSRNFFRGIHLEILSNVAEITAQKIDQLRKVEQLRVSREYNKAVLNSTPTSYLLLGRDKSILSLNKLARKVLPIYSGSKVAVGSSYTSVIPEKYQDEFCFHFEACLNGEVISLERKINDPDEEECWIKFIFSPAVNSDDEIFGVTLNIKNISSEKLAQRLMQEKNESLEMANKELDKVIYSVSHDLRAPVSNVIGLSTLIDVETELKEIKEYNALIQSSMRRMDNFIKNVLAYSRNSKVEPHYELEDLEDMLDGIIQDHSYMKGIGDIQFELDLKCKELITDHQRLSVILSNLISNAVKYHDPKKEKQWVKLRCHSDDMNIIIEVEDNGLGIEEENLSKLFNMYYMVNSMERSSGIGLYILKDSLKLLHGNIEARSKVGEGSCFSISLPKISKEDLEKSED